MIPIGQVVRRLRQDQQRTLEDLASHTGYDAGNLSKFERGVQGIDGEKLERIAQELATPVSSIYAEAELLQGIKEGSQAAYAARLLVDLNQITDAELRGKVRTLVSRIISGEIPRDRLDAFLKLLLT